MNAHERTVYALAEALHKCVYEIEQMPMTEYMGWLAYFEERNRRMEADKGNLLAMDEQEMVSRLTGE